MPDRALAAVIQHNDEFLVCQRPPQGPHAGLWGFPSGKVKQGETLPDAARRILSEYIGVEVKAVGWPQFSVADPVTDSTMEFVRVTIAGEPECRQCVALRRLPLDDLPSLLLAPGDRKFVEYLEQSVPNGRASGTW